MKPILGHNGTTKDTAPKPLVVNVEEGVPKLLFWHLRPRWKGVGTSGFCCRSKDVITSDLPTGGVGKSYLF